MQTEHDNSKLPGTLYATGPLALLPLDKEGDRRFCSLVWSQEPDEAERLMALDDTEFVASWGRCEYCLGKITATDRRFSYLCASVTPQTM